MGYEVLDSDGTDLGSPGAGPPPTDVIALDDLPEPAADEGPPQRRPLPVPLQRVRDRAFPRVSRDTDDRSSRLTRATWALATGTAVVGLLLGLFWSGHHADQVRQAQARSTVTALASLRSLNRVRTGQGPAVELAIDVFNVGALPLDVVRSPSGARLSYGTPVVTPMSSVDRIEPGSSATVTARLLLACDSRDPVELTVPVRAPDGEVHRLPMQTGQWQTAELRPYDLCQQADDGRPPLDAEMLGSLLRPTLTLRNGTAEDMTVSWADDGTPGLSVLLDRLDLKLTPPLPITLGPNEQRTLRVDVTTVGCPRNVSLDDLNSHSNLMLHGQAPSGQVGEAWVQITAVLGAALQRACG